MNIASLVKKENDQEITKRLLELRLRRRSPPVRMTKSKKAKAAPKKLDLNTISSAKAAELLKLLGG